MGRQCEFLASCPFFNDVLPNMPATAGLLKEEFCASRMASCARYRVRMALGLEFVPKDLFPDEVQRADEILREAH